MLLAGFALARADWVLTFEDDFTGSSLNTSSWTVADRDATKSQYDGHDAMFVKENVAVADGNLVITTTYGGNRCRTRILRLASFTTTCPSPLQHPTQL